MKHTRNSIGSGVGQTTKSSQCMTHPKPGLHLCILQPGSYTCKVKMFMRLMSCGTCWLNQWSRTCPDMVTSCEAQRPLISSRSQKWDSVQRCSEKAATVMGDDVAAKQARSLSLNVTCRFACVGFRHPSEDIVTRPASAWPSVGQSIWKNGWDLGLGGADTDFGVSMLATHTSCARQQCENGPLGEDCAWTFVATSSSSVLYELVHRRFRTRLNAKSKMQRP